MFSANELVCERGERLLFRNLGFELGRGEALLVGGGNGRGKTSLLRILCGLSAPAAGTVRWRGEPIGRTGIKDDLSPMENLRIAAALNGRALDVAAATAALERIGLSRCMDLPARVLSFGQRRRVALAGLMTAGALLWILDEPLTGLDVEGVALVERMIRDHVMAGGLAIMTTHQPMSLDGLTPQTLSVGT
ncbi:MAG: heme ABC exporter, ATP-binding protein CcmA [Thiobacillus sp. SCN 63-1177]|nr:MAG: heme ABC exporter, ATP-binding protein CcmA [Thiobacillus sp. SCN 63-1177]